MNDSRMDTPDNDPDNDRSTVQEHSEPSIMEILAYYHQDGFTADAFATENGMILCGECSSVLSPDHVEVHSIRRLEGESDPSDSVGVIAMVCPVCHSWKRKRRCEIYVGKYEDRPQGLAVSFTVFQVARLTFRVHLWPFVVKHC